ncbi:hypothetical protein [Burkholderia sp. Bp9142]|uniref:hypothetical protein n=1 Tax=Burkholderia sp. Bp9142 TaxID=2184573 RepID=UPI000F590F45|nr:hypothetical protein [Burkholderia sp. Bp9142]
MRSRNVVAEVFVEGRQISAHFRASTAHLVIREGSVIVETIVPPDSWMALATVNSGSDWGTRPTREDLQGFLERYITTHPTFDHKDQGA